MNPQTIRLNKYLAECGVDSRRACDELIAAGRVRINGRVVDELGTKITTGERVTVDGELVSLVDRKLYVLLNKPIGYIASVRDDRERKTVLDLIDLPVRIFPVGRLDLDSEGLLLLTNDGSLAYRLTHPRFKVQKTYRVRLDKDIDLQKLQQLEKGIMLEDGMTSPCTMVFWGKSLREVKVELSEGRKRQIRRMFAALGFTVRRLERTQFGTLTIKGLPRGKWRYLRDEELRQIRRLVGLRNADK